MRGKMILQIETREAVAVEAAMTRPPKIRPNGKNIFPVFERSELEKCSVWMYFCESSGESFWSFFFDKKKDINSRCRSGRRPARCGPQGAARSVLTMFRKEHTVK